MSDDLEALFPGVTVKAKGDEIPIRPFGFGQLSKVAKLCRPIAECLMNTGLLKITPNTDNTSTVTLDKDFVPKLFILLDEGLEPVLALLCYAINKPRVWLDDLPPDEGIMLTKAVYETNADFFVKRVIPILGSTFSKFATTGETLSQGSSVPGIVDQTSTNTL